VRGSGLRADRTSCALKIAAGVAEKVSEKLHEAYRSKNPELKMAQIAAVKVKALQPAELLSTASYRPGEMIEEETNKGQVNYSTERTIIGLW
jgi:hypothetical protein